MSAGIEKRHQRSCRSLKVKGAKCNCTPTYQASVWSVEDERKIRKTFPTIRAAKAWRSEASTAVSRGELRAATTVTVREAAEAWLEDARTGKARARSGDRFKPSAIRGYEMNLRLHVEPKLGNRRLSDLRRTHVQEFVDGLVGDGMAPATVQAVVIALKSLCRYEVRRGRLAVNPTAELDLPRVRSRRDRVADPVEAATLLDALAPADRALWATAFYAGLRRGELMALRASDVNLDAGLLHVRAGWDLKEGRIATKGQSAGEDDAEAVGRRVPICEALRAPLAAHLLDADRWGDQLVFGPDGTRPFSPRPISERADAAWRAAKLERITLHECRHTFASLMIAAGVNAKALCDYMGHASITTTLDLYGHLMPGNENEAAGMLDAYLQRAREAVD